MEKLSPTWLTDKLIDFEYKKYLLLAYLKNVKGRFDNGELYPQMADLVTHYKNLLQVKENKEVLYDGFPKEMSKIDLKKLELTYRHIIEDEDLMKELTGIINYALPRIETTIEEGKELYDWIEDNLMLSPVGVVPMYDKEGYFFIQYDKKNDLLIYRYNITLFENANDKFRGIKTTFVNKDEKSIARTAENIKGELIKTFRDLPNPATFLITSQLKLPLKQTLLPITKRMLLQRLAAA